MLFRGPVKKTGNEWITNVLPLELVPILHREARGPNAERCDLVSNRQLVVRDV